MQGYGLDESVVLVGRKVRRWDIFPAPTVVEKLPIETDATWIRSPRRLTAYRLGKFTWSSAFPVKAFVARKFQSLEAPWWMAVGPAIHALIAPW